LFEGNSNKMLAAGAGAFKQLPNYVRDPDAPVSLFGYTKPSSVGLHCRIGAASRLLRRTERTNWFGRYYPTGCSNTSIRFQTETDASAGY
jgi:hypothetical protein